MKRKNITYKEQLKELHNFVDNDMPKIIKSQRKAIQEFEKLTKGGKSNETKKRNPFYKRKL